MPVTSSYGQEVGEVEASTGSRRVRIDYNVVDGKHTLVSVAHWHSAR